MSEGTYKSRLRDCFGKDWCDQVLTGDYRPAIPLSLQDVDITAVLPTVFYMIRSVQRRGKGRFTSVFGADPTVGRLAADLARTAHFKGFDAPPAQDVLSDLLLGFCLENRNRSERKTEPVRRALPTHYFAAWLDLPEKSVDLRYIPETLVAMLAGQSGPWVEPSAPDDPTPFPVGRRFQENLLLKPFLRGVLPADLPRNLPDRFDEVTSVTLPEWLMIRLAERLEQPPQSLGSREGGARIPNQQPLACVHNPLRDDLAVFIAAYGETMPRGVLIGMLESALAVGLTTMLTSTAEALGCWAQDGRLPQKQPRHCPLLLDASNGRDRELARAAEKIFAEQSKRLECVPVILMALRLLDYEAERRLPAHDPLPAATPHGDARLTCLGDLLYARHPASQTVLAALVSKAETVAAIWPEPSAKLATALRDRRPAAEIVLALAQVLTELRGRKQAGKWFELLDSCALCDDPRGLVIKSGTARSGRTRRDIRRGSLPDATLDYLAHLWLAHQARSAAATLKGFWMWLPSRYGFHVTDPPLPGVTLADALLRNNQQYLENRLRDLGLLVSVSDAEAMKRLQPRFPIKPMPHETVS
ncbi:hypothetical protein J8C06_12295 [Chloracidobacterium validum]|uniref:Uncharacterized protein n=1 Tax=Chloracidobacterium validum TaxID=2821543 RepID=A0ABX8BC97_9BACT|nr:hypothetical protein [Chloracidobacterium validum]QUW04557.1 hypothetical protein J8C06_12295 [Chloracidobacterium validum]